MRQISITFVITGLQIGGAEMMLFKLVSSLDRTRFKPTVISLESGGPMLGRFESIDVDVVELGMKASFGDIARFFNLVWRIKQSEPDIVQTWMYHADLLGGLATRFFSKVPVLWGIRQSDLDQQVTSRSTRMIVSVCSWLSSWVPQQIVCCSHVAKDVHADLGYKREKIVVIPNGFDTTEFQPNAKSRDQVRGELKLSAGAKVIGVVGRYHPQKDHVTFLRAARMVLNQQPDAEFVLCGEGLDEQNETISRLCAELGLQHKVHRLGRRADVAELMTSFDLLCSSSAYGEGFPNVIGEAMACGIPVVTTDVGDSKLVVGATGAVVPPRSPALLARSLCDMLAIGREQRVERGCLARQRVVDLYSLNTVVDLFQCCYANACRLRTTDHSR